MKRAVRYQGAVVQGDQILLIQHREHGAGRSYWLLPGGGREEGESERACLQREIREETQLEVEVLELLLDEPDIPGGAYERLHTYRCRVVAGEARPGFEPEPEAAGEYAISAVSWVDLRRPSAWEPELRSDPWTYPLLQRLRAVLGYGEKE